MSHCKNNQKLQCGTHVFYYIKCRRVRLCERAQARKHVPFRNVTYTFKKGVRNVKYDKLLLTN